MVPSAMAFQQGSHTGHCQEQTVQGGALTGLRLAEYCIQGQGPNMMCSDPIDARFFQQAGDLMKPKAPNYWNFGLTCNNFWEIRTCRSILLRVDPAIDMQDLTHIIYIWVNLYRSIEAKTGIWQNAVLDIDHQVRAEPWVNRWSTPRQSGAQHHIGEETNSPAMLQQVQGGLHARLLQQMGMGHFCVKETFDAFVSLKIG